MIDVPYRLLLWVVLTLFAVVLLLFAFLQVQRAVASLIAAHAARRRAVLSPLVHAALDDPAAAARLSDALRRGDRPILRDLLLHLALDLRGEEGEAIAPLYRDMGFLEPELARLQGRNARSRAAAAADLGALRIRQALPALRRALEDRDTHVRIAAVRAVGELGDRADLAELVQRLGDRSSVVAGRAQEVLAEHGRAAAEEIISFAHTSESPAARYAAVDLLGWLRVPQAVEPLLDLVRDADPELRVKATKAAAAIGDPRFVEPFHALLEDSTWEVRCQAAKGLSALSSLESIPRLRVALRDHHWWVRFYAAVALAELGWAGQEALRQALEDSDPQVREMARYLLERGSAVPVLP